MIIVGMYYEYVLCTTRTYQANGVEQIKKIPKWSTPSFWALKDNSKTMIEIGRYNFKYRFEFFVNLISEFCFCYKTSKLHRYISKCHVGTVGFQIKNKVGISLDDRFWREKLVRESRVFFISAAKNVCGAMCMWEAFTRSRYVLVFYVHV